MPRRWVEERRRDRFYRAAQRDGLRSRAAYKLNQLQERFKIIPVGSRVLDLGAAPGGWSIVAREFVGDDGEVVAVDVRSFEPIDGVRFIRGLIGDPRTEERLKGEVFDVVISDMAPSISGNYSTDHARSVSLVRAAFSTARKHLKDRGTFVAKLFDGDMTRELRAELEKEFASFHLTKPEASRSGSSEVYLIGKGYRRTAASKE